MLPYTRAEAKNRAKNMRYAADNYAAEAQVRRSWATEHAYQGDDYDACMALANVLDEVIVVAYRTAADRYDAIGKGHAQLDLMVMP